MKTKTISFCICTLVIASIIPFTTSTDESEIDTPQFKVIAHQNCECTNNPSLQITMQNEDEYTSQVKHGLGHCSVPDWFVRTPLPDSIGQLLTDLDWRNNGGDYTTSAKNQGNCGVCWIFAALGALETMIAIANNNPNLNYDLSEQYILSCTGPAIGLSLDCQHGGDASYAFWYMKEGAPQNGALPESCFRYQAIDANGCNACGCGYTPVLCSDKCSNWQSQLIQTVTSYGYNDAGHGLTPQQIKSKLASGPVCLSFYVYNDFFDGPGYSPSFDSQGVYRWDRVSGYAGAHQVVCVGYQDSLGCWICKNSWGSDWGNMNGFFKIAYGECGIEYDMSWISFTQSGSNTAPNIPSNPSPLNHETDVNRNTDVSWSCSDPDAGDTLVYDVYFGTSSSPSLVSSDQSATIYDPGILGENTKYYWKIVAKDNHAASTTGPLWDFTTASGGNLAPNAPANPNPSNHAMDVDINADLGWSCSDPDAGDMLTYDVYFGISSSPTKVSSDQSASTYSLGILNEGTKYYWKIIAKDNHGESTTGSLWDFTTTGGGANQAPDTPTKPSGPVTGRTGVYYTYSTKTSDPDGDKIKYGWEFQGDDTIDFWTDYYNSGVTCSIDVQFLDVYSYYIRTIAEDTNGKRSQFSSGLTVVIGSGNHPPLPPMNPNPPTHATEVNINTDLSWTGGDPDSGDTVKYDIYFGVSSSPPKVKSDSTTTSYDPGLLNNGTKYYWRIIARDSHGESRNGVKWDFTTAGIANHAPNKPNQPLGINEGKIGTAYTYTCNTTDPDGNQLYYWFDWGDGNNSGWLGPYPSGDTASAIYTWLNKDSYNITVKAKDTFGAESPWSDPLPITMPYIFKPIWKQFFDWVFQRFPNAFPLLRQLKGY